MFRRLGKYLFATMLALAVAPMSGAQAKTAVSGVRLGQQLTATRVVLDLSERPTYRIGGSADPYRLNIDIDEATWETTANPARSGFIDKVRHAQIEPGKLRIILDLKQAAIVKHAMLLEPQGSYQYRLVLDLESVARAAFLRTTAPAEGAPKETPTVSAEEDDDEAPAAKPTIKAATPAKPRPPTPLAVPDKTVSDDDIADTAKEPDTVTAKPAKSVKQAKAKTGGPRRRVVAIDAGHGGVDPGTIGVSGGYEKTVTLATAKEIERQLAATGRYKPVLTRDNDSFVQLRERVSIARTAGADLFISLHADALEGSKVRGASVYTLSENASDAEAAALAAKENKVDLIAGIDLSREHPEVANILIELAQRETMNRSAQYANTLVTEITRPGNILVRSHRYAGFAVLKAPDIPSVLFEMGYLSSREDEKLLRDPKYRAKLAAAVVRSVDVFFAHDAKIEATAPKPQPSGNRSRKRRHDQD